LPAESSRDGHGRQGIALSAIDVGELLVVPRGHAHPREARFCLGGLDQLPQEGLGGLEVLEFDETADLRREGRVMLAVDMSRAVTHGSARYPARPPTRSITADVGGPQAVRPVRHETGGTEPCAPILSAVAPPVESADGTGIASSAGRGAATEIDDPLAPGTIPARIRTASMAPTLRRRRRVRHRAEPARWHTRHEDR